ncbi:hypothetical protein AZ20_3925 [Bordetella bronchiseptica E014]|nr:hypothetical protein L530_3977 [Bordetella bronchiseptica MO211]KDB72591.1 hypothetical protein L494_4030 [Bordetella bronchiseptica CA90 BB1334]KDC14699.1 hypothetical protein AZ20_3925 [Bordetella bronchiseptica E014]KDC94990.1 hypothetical protein L518_3666 [Bordetella bronchiseptica MBORD675]KDD17286.1 hypothetical protein L522_3964 [Bordetella bronchiseptica MBORD707]KDD40680.1 hypothetical protein L532_4054 [Bordetella bronchiseptica OSU095]
MVQAFPIGYATKEDAYERLAHPSPHGPPCPCGQADHERGRGKRYGARRPATLSAGRGLRADQSHAVPQ